MSTSASTTPAAPASAAAIADPTTSHHETDQKLVIRQVTPEITTFSLPFSRGGAPIGGRGTAIKLPTSEVFLYVSTPHTPATAETIARMGGEVRWLVTPDGEHTMYIEEYIRAYPNAQPIGVKALESKKPQIKWAGLFGAGGENKQYGFEPHVSVKACSPAVGRRWDQLVTHEPRSRLISLHNVSAFLNDELVAIHHPSGTLIEADMLFNLPPTEQYSRAGGIPSLMKLFGSGRTMSPGGLVHSKAADSLTKDKALLKTELAPIMAAKWDRLIPCHGDVIETGARAEWDKVWARFA